MANFKHPITVIFGAGATRGGLSSGDGLPPPVDADFFDIANRIEGHGTPALAKRVLRDVWSLYQRTNSVGLETYYRDLETRAKIGSFAKTANQPKNWEKRANEMAELIRRVFVQTTTIKDDDAAVVTPRESLLHKHILDDLEDGDTVITFNYDLIIEESFSSADKWNPIDGYGLHASGQRQGWAKRWLTTKNYERGTRSKVLLLKLHGSINWEPSPNNLRLKPRPYLVSTRKKKTRFEKISILAPGWNKRIDKNPYRKFWREARLRLEKCKTLIIVGYSLPETDLLARALLSEVVRMRAARKNASIKEFHIADPSDIVKEKLIGLFNPALGAYGKVFKYSGAQEFDLQNYPTANG